MSETAWYLTAGTQRYASAFSQKISAALNQPHDYGAYIRKRNFPCAADCELMHIPAPTPDSNGPTSAEEKTPFTSLTVLKFKAKNS